MHTVRWLSMRTDGYVNLMQQKTWLLWTFLLAKNSSITQDVLGFSLFVLSRSVLSDEDSIYDYNYLFLLLLNSLRTTTSVFHQHMWLNFSKKLHISLRSILFAEVLFLAAYCLSWFSFSDSTAPLWEVHFFCSKDWFKFDRYGFNLILTFFSHWKHSRKGSLNRSHTCAPEMPGPRVTTVGYSLTGLSWIFQSWSSPAGGSSASSLHVVPFFYQHGRLFKI